MDPCTIHMAPQTSVAAHVSNLRAAMAAHMQEDHLSEFHDVMIDARKLFWSLPLVARGMSSDYDIMSSWLQEIQGLMGSGSISYRSGL